MQFIVANESVAASVTSFDGAFVRFTAELSEPCSAEPAADDPSEEPSER